MQDGIIVGNGSGFGRRSAPTSLYLIGAVAAFTTVAITVVQVIVFIAWPPPSLEPTSSAVAGVFDLLAADRLRGLLDLDVLMIFDYVLLILVFVALFVALERYERPLMLIGTTIALVGIALYFASNPTLAMLALSDQYAAAAGQAQKTGLVTAGQAVMATFRGTPFIVHYIFMGIAGLLVSVVMLRSGVFSRVTAYAGLLQGAMMLVPSTAGAIGLVFAVGSLLPFSIWFVLVRMRLLRLSRRHAPGLQAGESLA